jgi:hypothetical protein
LTTAKMATEAATPITSVRIALTVKAGVRRRDRHASCRGCTENMVVWLVQTTYAMTFAPVSTPKPDGLTPQREVTALPIFFGEARRSKSA